jgi:lysozyme
MRAGIAVLVALGAAALYTAKREAEGADVVGGALRAVESVAAGVLGLMGFGMDSNTRAFLSMLSAAEGTGAHGYYTLFGGQPFLELDTHPGVRTWGEWTEPGKMNYTTAAGRYQITLTTWRRLAAKMGLADFSPATQDAMALELLREAGAAEDVRAGRFDAALQKVSGLWASLPYSRAPQAHRSPDFVADAYEAAGGVYESA